MKPNKQKDPRYSILHLQFFDLLKYQRKNKVFTIVFFKEKNIEIGVSFMKAVFAMI